MVMVGRRRQGQEVCDKDSVCDKAVSAFLKVGRSAGSSVNIQIQDEEVLTSRLSFGKTLRAKVTQGSESPYWSLTRS